MKKLVVVLFAAFSMMLFVSCMHECTCFVSQEFVSPGHYTVDVDTSVVPSKSDCSIMNEDTIYTFNAYDTSMVVDGHYAIIDTAIGQVHNITICQ